MICSPRQIAHHTCLRQHPHSAHSQIAIAFLSFLALFVQRASARFLTHGSSGMLLFLLSFTRTSKRRAVKNDFTNEKSSIHGLDQRSSSRRVVAEMNKLNKLESGFGSANKVYDPDASGASVVGVQGFRNQHPAIHSAMTLKAPNGQYQGRFRRFGGSRGPRGLVSTTAHPPLIPLHCGGITCNIGHSIQEASTRQTSLWHMS